MAYLTLTYKIKHNGYSVVVCYLRPFTQKPANKISTLEPEISSIMFRVMWFWRTRPRLMVTVCTLFIWDPWLTIPANRTIFEFALAILHPDSKMWSFQYFDNQWASRWRHFYNFLFKSCGIFQKKRMGSPRGFKMCCFDGTPLLRSTLPKIMRGMPKALLNLIKPQKIYGRNA